LRVAPRGKTEARCSLRRSIDLDRRGPWEIDRRAQQVFHRLPISRLQRGHQIGETGELVLSFFGTGSQFSLSRSLPERSREFADQFFQLPLPSPEGR
jgi:hypothetical protein